MSQFPSEFLKDIVQQATIITAGAAAIQLGPDIPDGHVRKITRLHIPADPAPATRAVELFRGSTNNNIAFLIDAFSVISGNPDFSEATDDLDAPLMTIHPDETPAAAADVEDKMFIRRIGAIDVRVSISFYDELA